MLSCVIFFHGVVLNQINFLVNLPWRFLKVVNYGIFDYVGHFTSLSYYSETLLACM